MAKQRDRGGLTNNQGQVDVVADELLQLELLTQSQVEGSAVHGQPVANLQCVSTHNESAV